MEFKQSENMSDGTLIRIEDWSKDYNIYKPFSKVVAYPIAKRSISAFIREGDSFRLEMQFKNESEAQKAYKQILNGEKTFKDYLMNIDSKYHNCI